MHTHLMISSGISKDKETRLTEGCLELVSEGTRSVSPGNGMRTCVLCKLQHCSLTIWPRRLNNYVLWILNGNNNSSSQLQFFPGFTQIDNKDTYKVDNNTRSSALLWYLILQWHKPFEQLQWVVYIRKRLHNTWKKKNHFATTKIKLQLLKPETMVNKLSILHLVNIPILQTHKLKSLGHELKHETKNHASYHPMEARYRTILNGSKCPNNKRLNRFLGFH